MSADAFVMTLILCYLINYIPGLHFRASEDAEIVGLDEAECGEVSRALIPPFFPPAPFTRICRAADRSCGTRASFLSRGRRGRAEGSIRRCVRHSQSLHEGGCVPGTRIGGRQACRAGMCEKRLPIGPLIAAAASR